MKKFEKLKEKLKKEGHKLPKHEMKAKIGVVEALKDMADDMLKARGLKKVSVMSDSDEGLKAGLDMAKHKVAEHDEEDEPEAIRHELEEEMEMTPEEHAEHEAAESPEHDELEHEMFPEEYEEIQHKFHEAEESPEEEMEEHEDGHEDGHEDEEHEDHEDEDALDAHIAKLMEKKKQLAAKKYK